MKHKNTLANRIMRRNADNFDRVINVSALSAKIGKPKSTIWGKLSAIKKWDVESWIECLCALGFARVNIQGDIIIKAKLIDRERQRLNSYKLKDITAYRTPKFMHGNSENAPRI